jgi:hypothetical protein
VGLYKLNPVDPPQLESAWFHQPLSLSREKLVSKFAFSNSARTATERRSNILGELGIDASLLEDPAKLTAAVETLRAEAEAEEKEAAEKEAQQRRLGHAGADTSGGGGGGGGGPGLFARPSKEQTERTTMALVGTPYKLNSVDP